MFSLKKHIVILFVFVLFVPSTIQNLHALESHEHTVCNSISEYHIHEQNLDCSELHIPFKTLSVTITTKLETVTEHLYKITFTEKTKAVKVLYLNPKSSRAPPVIA